MPYLKMIFTAAGNERSQLSPEQDREECERQRELANAALRRKQPVQLPWITVPAGNVVALIVLDEAPTMIA